MDSLRKLSAGRHLPNRRQLVSIIHLLHKRILEGLCAEVDRVEFVNLAIDGWTDPCNRRYQGVTARFVYGNDKVKSAVLVLKEVLEVHETGESVRAVIDNIVNKFGLGNKILNICTDRDSKNTHAVVTTPLPDGCYWLPCAAHFLNLVLLRFYNNSDGMVDRVFHMAKSLRRRPGFTAFLQQSHSKYLRLPTYSHIRWYSSSLLFSRLQALWPQITAYCKEEDLTFPALHKLQHITELSALANSFHQTEAALEGDHFGSAAHFIPKLLSIIDNIRKFTDHPMAVQAVMAYVGEFKGKYRREWSFFLLTTFLRGNDLHFMVGTEGPCTCSPAEFAAMRDLALELIDFEIARDRAPAASAEPTADPPSDDYTTPRSRARSREAVEQFRMFDDERIDFAPGWWKIPKPSVRHLAAVAARVASLMITSSSIERAPLHPNVE
jgi:hypothetical protein